jgi:DNA-directed RNA polymerase specialized sigma24 family protein
MTSELQFPEAADDCHAGRSYSLTNPPGALATPYLRWHEVVLVNVGDRDVAQDLVDEAFARAWASWRSVSRHPAPAAWVVRAALNASISRWRHRRREVSLPDPGTVATWRPGPGPPTAPSISGSWRP